MKTQLTYVLVILFRAAVAVLLVVLARPLHADDRFDGLDAYVKAAMEKWQVPAVSIAVVKDGKVVLAQGYGVREVGQKEAVDGQTVFRIASITKTFTATTVALLVEEGKLKWDDPVKSHFPTFELADPYMTANTTLRDLPCHRVRLETGDIVPRRGDLSKDEILARLKYLKPVFPFRSKYKYSNLMYLAAGELVSRVSGEPWEDFVTKRLFEPLGMTSTTSTFDRIRSKNLAAGYRLHDGQLERTETSPLNNVVAPAGLITSSAEDMAQWLKFWLSEGKVGGKRLIEPKTVREMLAMHCAIPVTWTGEGNVYAAKYYGWGLGWSVLDYRGRKIHTHTGGSGTFIAFMPQEQIGVVVLTNMEFTNLSGMLAYDVFDAYLLDAENRWSQKNWPQWLKSDEPPQVTGDKARQKLEQTRKTGTKPPTGLKNLAGKYRSDLYGEIELLFVNDDLSLRLGTNPPVAVKHWQDGSFISPCPIADSPWFDWLIHFRLNPAGIAESLDIDRIGWDEPMPRFQRVGNR